MLSCDSSRRENPLGREGEAMLLFLTAYPYLLHIAVCLLKTKQQKEKLLKLVNVYQVPNTVFTFCAELHWKRGTAPSILFL